MLLECLLVNTVIRLVIDVISHVLIVFVLVTCSWSQGAWPRPTCQYFRSEMDPSTLPWVRPASWVETPSPGQCMSRSVCSSVCLSVVWLCVSLPVCVCVCVCVALCLCVSHRVPTRPGKPGKPGKMRVHLENLEISWNFEKFNKYHGKMTWNLEKVDGY